MELNYFIVGMGLLFALLGFVLTESNARYLLAGYNTMSKEKQDQFDLKSYIPFFRNFHLILGSSFLVLGLAVNTLGNETYTAIFLTVYPLIFYTYLLIKGKSFWHKSR